MSSLQLKPLSVAGRPISGQDRSLIPIGMTTILPEAARRIRVLQQTLLTQLSRWGYQEIILPTFEYLDVLAPALEPELIEKCYQFADRTTGRILLLRPDATAQIARTVAMGMMGTRFPMRLCYRTSVFRYESEHAGRDREISQVGAELIGVDDLSRDSEIISLMIDCLLHAGLTSFKVSVGHVGFFKQLLAQSGMSDAGQKRAEQAAARKDLPRLEEVLAQERVTRATAKAILEAPGLYGREEVLQQGRRLAGRNQALLETLDRLSRVYEQLVAAGRRDMLLLDLGEFRGFDYYDGIVFDVFAEGVGSELGGGGRYDHLIGRFGSELPSTGFALDLDRLFRAIDGRCMPAPSSRADYLVATSPQAWKRSAEVASILRSGGFRVIEGGVKLSGRDVIPAAIREARAEQAAAVVVLGVSGTEADEAIVVENILNDSDFMNPAQGTAKRARTKMKITALAGIHVKDRMAFAQ
ncbi:MAG: ATP phosphoribosyltransferase regulatory subunit [Nitrospiraceae bacterium]